MSESIKGFSSRNKLVRDNLRSEPCTRQPVTPESEALEVKSHTFAVTLASVTTAAGSTTSRIVLTAPPSNILPGDVIHITSGVLQNLVYHIQQVSSATLILTQDLPSAPGAGITATLRRFIPPSVDSTGAIVVGLPAGISTAANQVIEQGYLSNIQLDLERPVRLDTVSGEYAMRVSGWGDDASQWFNLPLTNFGTTVPVALGAGIYGAGIGNTGSITGAAQTVILNTLDGYFSGIFSIRGTYSATFIFEGLRDTTWEPIFATRVGSAAPPESSTGALVNTSRMWRVNATGYETIRIRCTSYTSGTAIITVGLDSLGTSGLVSFSPTGQTTMANAPCVSLASDQTAIPVSQSGAWTFGNNTTGISDGRKTVATAGTRETLAASTACKWVTITAETDNTGLVVVGGTTVVASLSTRQGTPLYAGDSVTIYIDNLNDVNLDVTVNGDGVTYTYGT